MPVRINGKVADTIDYRDRGLHYGDGLFETMRARGGRVALLELHLDRLIAGCRRLKITPPSRRTLSAEINRAARQQDEGVLKLIITRGIGERGYRFTEPCTPTRLLIVEPLTLPQSFPNEVPVKVRICRTRLAANPAFAGMKTLNRLESVMARSEWRDPRIAEGLMQDEEGNIVCGTMTNIFMARGRKFLTPKLDRCGVAGVMRRWILESADACGLSIVEGRIRLPDLLRAEEIFLSNAVIGIWSVGAVLEGSVRARPKSFAAARTLRARLAEQ